MVPIHHPPKQSPRKGAKPKPVVDTLVDHTAAPIIAVEGDRPTDPPIRRGHTLDTASRNAKIVVTTAGAVLVTPEDGASLLPSGDLAHRLPIGAKIEKLNDGQYRASQLNAQSDASPALYETAVDAIQGFVPHFFPDWR